MQTDRFLITPMNRQLSLDPGEVYHGTVRVVNPVESTSDFDFVVGVSPYGVVGEEYDIDLMNSTYWTKITDWIEIENPKGTLKPNETEDVNFTITVPENAAAGAQFAAIVVSQDKDGKSDNGMKVENVFEMASIIYANINGENVHEGQILENNIPTFSTDAMVTVGAKFDNHGNVYEKAMITIAAKNVINGEEYLPNEDSSGNYEEIIIPDTDRYVTREVNGLPVMGIVHIEQKVVYNGETSYEAKDVLICPIWFIALVIIAIGMIIGTIVVAVKKHKRKKADIFVG